jgi:hypothetical protein
LEDIVISGVILAIVIAAGPVGASVEQQWHEVEVLRANRDRDMIRHGLEGEANALQRSKAERSLSRTIMGHAYPIDTGHVLVSRYIDGAGYVLFRVPVSPKAD